MSKFKTKYKHRQRYLIISILLSFYVLGFSQGTYMWNGERLYEIKTNQDLYKDIIGKIKKDADRFTIISPLYITDKPSTFVKDTHNYASLSIYYWPDPTNPKGKYILHDGQKNPEYKQYDGGKLEELEHRMRALSIGYYVTGELKYRLAYLIQLRSWFIDKSTYMYPNFEYAQIAPGHDNNRGRSAGLIEAYNFNSIIDSFRLVNSISPIDKTTKKAFIKWFKRFLNWLKTSEQGKKENENHSNHGIAYDVMLLNINLLVNGSLDNNLVNNFRSFRLERQIAPDGSQPAELQRSRALHFSVYNLSHIIDFCRILEHSGIHYYRNNKDLIDRAFNYLMQFVGNRKQFPYKEIGDWEQTESNLLREYNRLKSFKLTESKTDFDFFSSLLTIYL